MKDGTFAAEGRFSVEKFPQFDGIARRMGGDALELSAEGVSVRFGGLVAVDDVSLAIAPGEVLRLIGPNGAGKTTWSTCCLDSRGRTRARSGWPGNDMTGREAGAFARAGIVRSFQAVRLFRGLTVSENIEVGLVGRGLGPRGSEASGTFPALRFRPAAPLGPAGECSQLWRGAPRRLARQLALEPRFLLLDEPLPGWRRRKPMS